ncbi:MAG: MmcQ/YjbR family DNA-binding protein [Chitinophagales bacterium]|nr:MmcQ/YjbR family DNA-binding protein [Chitinophagales bacterium]
MNHEMLREYCKRKKGVTEDFPFDNDTLVYRVMGKIFLLTSLEYRPFRLNLKCDPERAIELREKYTAVYPAYHMNKRHWNSVEDNGTIPQSEILGMIDDSYNLVLNNLPKKYREG